MSFELGISPHGNFTQILGENKTLTDINSGNSTTTSQIDKFVTELAFSSLHTVLNAHFMLQIVFLIVGLARLFQYRKASVVKEEYEKFSSTLIRWMVKGHVIVSCLWIFEAFLQISIHPGSIFSHLICIIVWPVLSKICEYENTHKFSVPSKLRNFLPAKGFWISSLIFDFSSSLLQTYLWSEIALKGKVIIGVALIRAISLGGIVYLRKVAEDDFKKIKEKKKGEDEDVTIFRYKRYWKFMRNNLHLNSKAKAWVACCFALIAIDRALWFCSRIVYKHLMDSIHALTTGKNLSNSETPVVNGGSNSSQTEHVEFRWDLLFIQTLIWIFSFEVVSNVRDFLWNQVQLEVNKVAQVKMFRKIQDLSLKWHLETGSGEVLSILRYGSSSVFWFFQNLFFYNFPDWLDVIIYIVYVGAVYPRVLNSIIFLTTITSILIHFFGLKSHSEKRKAEIEANEKQMSEAIDSLTNYETMKYFNNEEHEASKFALAFQASEESSWERRLASMRQDVGQTVVRQFGSFFGSLLCYWMIFNNEGLTVGDYHMFGSHLYRFFQPLSSFNALHRDFKDAVQDIKKMTDVMEQEIEAQDGPNAQKLKSPSGEITFRDVHFGYVPEREVLHGISFTIPPGQTYAIVGPTGSGKSTVIRLLFRFYEIKSGSISIGGEDIREVKMESLRKAIAVIPQDPVLLHQSIKNNILYGNLSSPKPEEDVIAAAKCAWIHERIESFPDKYDTVVGTRGLKLSGGERQRIAIARAVMKNPPILLMDEATSSLDSKTERQIQKTLQTICKNRTTLIIAHRLSTVINADKILVLDEGKIVESGTHSELTSLGGMYAEMYDGQINPGKNYT